jgi:regulator of replication initiation timing
MSVSDTAKEVVRIASTAGLSKDVIDLMEKKLALLTTELDDTRQKIAALEREKAQLKAEIDQLRKQLERLQPGTDALPAESERMLVVFASSSRGITSDHVIQQLGFSQAQGDYYFDQLLKRKFVHASSGQMGVGWFYYATPEGRDYLARHGLL